MITIKDSRGRESVTLGFVTISWAVLVAKFALAGISVGAFGKVPEMSASEFGTAAGIILGIWLGREWQARAKP